MKNRVLVIGLDGGTFAILDPWMAKGKLPHIQKIVHGGFRSVLMSTVPPVSAPAWASFITGKNPGKHSVLQFYDVGPIPAGKVETEVELRPGDYAIVNAKSVKGKTLWEIASEAGRKVVVINVPMTYPPIPVNGVMITGLLTPPGSTNFTYPPELAASLTDYEIDLTTDEKDFNFPDKKWIIQRQREILEKRWQASVRLMKEYDWDLFTVVFTGIDRLQHRFWRCLDPSADSDPAEMREYYDMLEEYYARLDWIVGDLVRQAGEDVRTIILSDHGFGPMPKKVINTHLFLKELEAKGDGNRRNWATVLRSFLNRIGLDVRNRQKYLGRVIPRSWLRRAEQVGMEHVWSVSKARIVALHTHIGGLWINRERVGEQSSEYESLRNELMSKLRELQDPEDGTYVVSSVFRREEIYTGEFLPKTPDLVFMLSPGYRLFGGATRTNSFVSIPQTPYVIQGDHLPEGILILSGDGVRNTSATTNLRIEDVTATTLYLLGIPVPTDMDGRVITDAFDASFVQMNPVEFVEASSLTTSPATDESASPWESEEDERNVKEHLRALGYLD